MSVRVLVVDDQELVRSGFRSLLESDPEVHVVGEAGDGVEAVEQAARLRPDVVLMDVRMPRRDGIEATGRLLGAVPDGVAPPRVLMLTTFDVEEYVVDALRAGASGFLLKDATRDELLHAVHVVAAGDALLAPSATRRLIDRVVDQPLAAPGPEYEQLTERERQVLALLATGASNAEVAQQLHLGEATVKTHVGHVLMKLGVRDRVQAVIYVYEHGLAAGSPERRN